MKKFENPTVEVKKFDAEDIITTSVEDRLPGDDL